MDKIVILASPVAPTQQIFIYSDNRITDKIGAPLDHINNIVPAIIETSGIKQIEISGNRAFALGIQEQLLRTLQTEFTSISDVNIICI